MNKEKKNTRGNKGSKIERFKPDLLRDAAKSTKPREANTMLETFQPGEQRYHETISQGAQSVWKLA